MPSATLQCTVCSFQLVDVISFVQEAAEQGITFEQTGIVLGEDEESYVFYVSFMEASLVFNIDQKQLGLSEGPHVQFKDMLL